MGKVIGEFVATYLMMALGLGANVVVSDLDKRFRNQLVVGIYWSISILIASLVGSYFWGTSDLSPLFSFAQAVNHQITWLIMAGEIISQIISTWLASETVYRMWSRWFRKIPLKLEFFSTVPRNPHRNWYNFFWELCGTAIIVISSLISNQLPLAWWVKIIWSSILMLIVITAASPITGAALNPIRDLVPREYFSDVTDPKRAQWNYAIVPLFGPISGCLLVLALAKIV